MIPLSRYEGGVSMAAAQGRRQPAYPSREQNQVDTSTAVVNSKVNKVEKAEMFDKKRMKLNLFSVILFLLGFQTAQVIIVACESLHENGTWTRAETYALGYGIVCVVSGFAIW